MRVIRFVAAVKLCNLPESESESEALAACGGGRGLFSQPLPEAQAGLLESHLLRVEALCWQKEAGVLRAQKTQPRGRGYSDGAPTVGSAPRPTNSVSFDPQNNSPQIKRPRPQSEDCQDRGLECVLPRPQHWAAALPSFIGIPGLRTNECKGA